MFTPTDIVLPKSRTGTATAATPAWGRRPWCAFNAVRRQSSGQLRVAYQNGRGQSRRIQPATLGSGFADVVEPAVVRARDLAAAERSAPAALSQQVAVQKI